MSSATYNNNGYITRQGRMNSSMGLGREGPHPVYPGIVGLSFIGETSYRGFYRFWREMLEAPDWDAIRAGDATWDAMWTNRNFWTDRAKEQQALSQD
jgi:3-phenylpropionate/trans-cinnamate dioxygenase alpha subunit